MGLDTTHDCWHGSYSGFGAFRGAIVAAIPEAELPAGIAPAVDHDGRGYTASYRIVGNYPMRCYHGWWDDDRPYSDPLEVLLVHSDCDGYIFPTDAQVLADRLDGLRGAIAGEWLERLDEFVAGLRRAFDEYEIVGFH